MAATAAQDSQPSPLAMLAATCSKIGPPAAQAPASTTPAQPATRRLHPIKPAPIAPAPPKNYGFLSTKGNVIQIPAGLGASNTAGTPLVFTIQNPPVLGKGTRSNASIQYQVVPQFQTAGGQAIQVSGVPQSGHSQIQIIPGTNQAIITTTAQPPPPAAQQKTVAIKPSQKGQNSAGMVKLPCGLTLPLNSFIGDGGTTQFITEAAPVSPVKTTRRSRKKLPAAQTVAMAQPQQQQQQQSVAVAEQVETLLIETMGDNFIQGYQNLPIDIQTSKLLDWLVDRRHCNLKWQSSVLQIRGKINTAIQDMPENEEIKTLLAGSSEVASLLVRNVSYEIPSLKKQLSKSQQLQQEFSRKEVECQNGAAIMREKFHSSCKQYGITGDNVKRELLALVKDLPSTLGEVGKETCSLSEAIELYAAFGEFVCDWSSEPALPLLRHTQCRGNTTVYEWRTGSPPSVVERPSVEEEGVPATEDSIDWGTLGSDGDSASDGIDYGIAAADGGVDWGISLEPGALEADAGDIDWGEETASPVEIEVVEMGTNCPEGVARGEDALTLLENPATRNQFIDELMETSSGLLLGYSGAGVDFSNIVFTPPLLSSPPLPSTSRDKVLGVLSLVKGLIERLTSVRMQHLFMIQASPRYVDRVTELLRQKLKQADILVLKQQAMAERRQEALREQGQLEPRIDLLVQRTKELQKQSCCWFGRAAAGLAELLLVWQHHAGLAELLLVWQHHAGLAELLLVWQHHAGLAELLLVWQHHAGLAELLLVWQHHAGLAELLLVWQHHAGLAELLLVWQHHAGLAAPRWFGRTMLVWQHHAGLAELLLVWQHHAGLI
ncbi:UNVERIFIED_CONTAM: hypothetical protein FKN15_056681 [Acipenser sinensis]